jgi:hypothetical protein
LGSKECAGCCGVRRAKTERESKRESEKERERERERERGRRMRRMGVYKEPGLLVPNACHARERLTSTAAGAAGSSSGSSSGSRSGVVRRTSSGTRICIR